MPYSRKPGESGQGRRSRGGITRTRSAENVRSDSRSVFYSRMRISRYRDIDRLRNLHDMSYESTTSISALDLPSTSRGPDNSADRRLAPIAEEDPEVIREMEMNDLMETIQLEMASMELTDDQPKKSTAKISVSSQTDDEEPSSTSKKTKHRNG